MNQLWFEDMMSQSFHEDICFNPTKLFILQFIARGSTIEKSYKIRALTEYVYRVYMDNPQIAIKHPSHIVRNLRRYGVVDLLDLVSDALDSWNRDSKNHVLHYNNQIFWLEIDYQDAVDIAKNTKRLSQMIYKRVFKGTIPAPIEYDSIYEDGHYPDYAKLGQGRFRDRVLEDMQYCPLCESICTEELYAIHIVNESMGATSSELSDKENGIILCREHAEDFLAHRFEFDERGFVQKICECNVEKGMHLSFAIRTPGRKSYLLRRLGYYKNNGR